jgi:hypothetical protein
MLFRSPPRQEHKTDPAWCKLKTMQSDVGSMNNRDIGIGGPAGAA